MAEGHSLVKTVVQVLNDGEKGFADIGQKLTNPELKAFFLQESARRGKFAKELEAELALAAGDTAKILAARQPARCIVSGEDLKQLSEDRTTHC